VFLAVLTAPLSASSVSSSSEAQAWLRNHAGSPNELDELKGANPEAFAIVQALLTKRSLGLLNNKHPTASMTDMNSAPQEETPGPEAFAKIAQDSGSTAQMSMAAAAPKVELPYALPPGHSHHNAMGLNWKPDSSAQDEAMVANVLGMVGGMKSGASAPVDAPEAFSEPEAPFVQQRQVVGSAAEEVPATAGSWGDMGGLLALPKKPHHPVPVAAVSEDVPGAVQHPSKKDWGSVVTMKQNSDEKAVSSLLKMVAQMKGGKAAQKLLEKHVTVATQESSLSGDLAAWGDAPEEAPAMAAVAPAPLDVGPAVIEAPAAPVAEAAAPEPEKASSWANMEGMLKMHHAHHHMAAAAVKTRVAAAAQVELPYASVTPKHHDFFNWKPPSSEADSAMVANALGMMGMNSAPKVAAAPEEAPEALAHVPEVEVVHHEEAPAAHGEDKDSKAVNSLLNMVAQLKGGKAAEKLLNRHHAAAPVAVEEDVFSRGAAAVSEPAAIAEAAPASSDGGWGSFGAMLGVKPKAKPVAMRHAMVESEAPSAGALSSEVMSLGSDNWRPVHHAARQAQKSVDYKKQMATKQNADDSAVKSLLSMVARLKGGAKAEKLVEKYDTGSTEEAQSDSPLAKDDGIFGNPFGTPMMTEAPAQPEAPAQLNYVEEAPTPVHHHHHHFASLAKSTSYVAPAAPVEAAQEQMVEEVLEAPAAPARKRNFLDSSADPVHHVSAIAQNSYLKMFDLKTEAEQTDSSHAAASSGVSVATARADFEATANDFRSSFAKSDSSETVDFEKTWQNSADSKAQAIQQFMKAPVKAASAPHKKGRNLLAWLDSDAEDEPAAAPKAVVAAKPEVSGNPYIADLM